MPSAQNFDYIVVGAGAAGSLISSRLAEKKNEKVCVLEAGPRDWSIYTKIPAGFVNLLRNPKYIWNFETEPTNLTGGRAIPLLQGKILGGGTSVNGMAFNRGQRGDFDAWAALGNEGWSYKDVLPAFKNIECCDQGSAEFRGRSGRIRVTDAVWDEDICRAFMDAAIGAGVPLNPDTNGARQEGVAFSQVTISSGRRVSSSTAYLTPANKYNNLTIITHALATRIIFSGNRAIGIEYTRNGITNKIFANKEIIISCGAINTPKILQLSGVGDAKHLNDLDIPVVSHLPGVGRNLQDHYLVRIVAKGRNFKSINQMAKQPELLSQLLFYIFGKKSILSLPAAVMNFFIRTDVDALDADVQAIFTPASSTSGNRSKLDSFPGMTCAVWQHRPLSRGYVEIRSKDVNQNPIINPNYLAEPDDRRVLVAGCRKMREILSSEYMSKYVDYEVAPGKSVESEEEWINFASSTGNTVYHPVGTAKMGLETDRLSVVSNELKVHGLDNLRVVDASIMPQIVSGNTAATTLMIAEKAYQLISG